MRIDLHTHSTVSDGTDAPAALLAAARSGIAVGEYAPTVIKKAVVGTGATAVQAIPMIAQQARHLTVFQRTANYCVPARNGKVDPEVECMKWYDIPDILFSHLG